MICPNPRTQNQKSMDNESPPNRSIKAGKPPAYALEEIAAQGGERDRNAYSSQKIGLQQAVVRLPCQFRNHIERADACA
jgi:hypothetical protein